VIRPLLALLLLAAAPARAEAPAPPTVAGAGALLAEARKAREEGRLDDALRALDQLLGDAPDHEALLDRGQLLAWQGRYGEALDAYRRFRERHPDRALDADLRTAQAQAWMGELGNACATLAPWVARGERRAVLDDATYRSWRGELDEVARRLGAWLGAHRYDREARLALARIRTWQGRNAEARAEYQAVLVDAPEERDAAMGLARLELWDGRPAQARARLAALPAELRRDPELRLLEARLSQAEGRPGDARAALGSLRTGATAREAERFLDELTAAHGPWARLAFARTDTSEGLVQQAPALTLRMPAGQGQLDLVAGWSEVSFHGATRGAALFELSTAQPLGAAAKVDGGLGWRDGFGGRRGVTVRGGATLRLRPRLDLRLDAARQLLDATPRAVDLRNTMTTAEAGVTWAADPATTLSASGGLAWVSAGSWRRAGAASAERRWKVWRLDLKAGVTGRAFGYSESLDLGLFNPRSYRFGGVTAGAALGRGSPLELEVGGQGGWQKVNADGVRFAWGYSATAAWGARGLQLLGIWSQSFAGLPVESAADPGSYREQSFRVALRYTPGG